LVSDYDIVACDRRIGVDISGYIELVLRSSCADADVTGAALQQHLVGVGAAEINISRGDWSVKKSVVAIGQQRIIGPLTPKSSICASIAGMIADIRVGVARTNCSGHVQLRSWTRRAHAYIASVVVNVRAGSSPLRSGRRCPSIIASEKS